jgi:hypothetical protein
LEVNRFESCLVFSESKKINSFWTLLISILIMQEMEPPGTLISCGCQSQRKELMLRKKQIGYVTST